MMCQIIIFNQLPEGFEIKNDLSNTKAELKLHEKETLSENEIKLKNIIGIGMALFVIGCLWMFMSKKTSSKKTEPAKIVPAEQIAGSKNKIITTESIEETITNKSGTIENDNLRFKGKSQVKVGDYVSYQDQENIEFLAKLKERDWGTPLAVNSYNQDFGTTLKTPILPTEKNSYTRVFLENEINTQSIQIPVSAVSYMDLTKKGKVLIPQGSKFIGKSSLSRDNLRINIQFTAVIFPNGREYSVKGVALSEDNIAGLQGYTDHQLGEKGKSTVASSFLSALSQTARVTSSGFGGIFAGEMADNSSDVLDSTLDYETKGLETSISIPMNTKFKIIFQ